MDWHSFFAAGSAHGGTTTVFCAPLVDVGSCEEAGGVPSLELATLAESGGVVGGSAMLSSSQEAFALSPWTSAANAKRGCIDNGGTTGPAAVERRGVLLGVVLGADRGVAARALDSGFLTGLGSLRRRDA